MAKRQGATRESPAASKRALEEVVPAAFVAREDEGGAYSIFETPKWFVHGYKGRLLTDDPRVRAFELAEAEYTARRLRLIGFVGNVIRKMDEQDAARAASAAAQHSPSSSLL